MHWRSTTRKSLAFLTFVCLIWAAPASAQVEHESGIPLKLNEDYAQPMGYAIAFGDGDGEPAYGLAADSGSGLGRAPGGVLVRVERVKGQPAAYRIQVDSDGDGDVAEEAAQVAAPDSSVMVKVSRRRAGGKQRPLPYSIKYTRDTDRSNRLQEVFRWSPHYRAEGRIKVNNCETLFAVLDLNGDGVFDRADFSAGTSINLDRNGDGQIRGQGEWLKGEQIIEYCGDALLIDSVEADGASVSLSKTRLRVPKVGERLPSFSLKTIDGRAIGSDDLKGKVHLLDFWASWCRPCVEKFPLVMRLGEEIEGGLAVVAVNVDEASRLPMARQIVKHYRLPWPHVMSGEGERDSLWKMFGGMEDNKLGIPLYVLIDEQGVLRYAGNGGTNLSELRLIMKGLAAAK